MDKIIQRIENKADELLQSLAIESIPVPVEDIAKKCNIRISRAPSEEFSGLLIRKKGEALIGLNSKEAVTRQRFTIAHELGHLFLHHTQKAFVDYLEHRNPSDKPLRNIKEKEADRYAAAILMPKTNMEKDFRKIVKGDFSTKHLKVLAKKYGVSEQAMNFRLINLKLIK